MAALLPHANDTIELKVEDKKLMPYIQGKKIELPADRVNYIKSNVPSHVMLADTTSDNFLTTIVDDSINLMIIRSIKIDAAGEIIKEYRAMKDEIKADADTREQRMQAEFEKNH